jgi:hypothetical protein
MNAATCAVLAGVFPLILIAIVSDRRSIHLKIKRQLWYRVLVIVTVTACLVGLWFAVIGVQKEGFEGPTAAPLWMSFGIASIALTMSIVFTIATQESEEDATAPHEDPALVKR